MSDEVPVVTPTLSQEVIATAAAKRAPGVPDYEKQLAEATAKIATLEAERITEKAKTDEALAAQHLRTVAVEARRPSEPLGTGMDDLKLHQAIKASGGPAYWNQLSAAQRANALGIAGSEDIPDKELKRYFGSGSSGAAAMSLSRTDPARYKKYRQLCQLKGIL